MVKSPSLSTLSMTAPIDPITVTTALNVSIRLTNTIQSATWYWGNGASSAGTITGSTVTGSNNYAMAGVYSVTVTVKDVCGLTATQALSNYIVVYDPSAGFVTGGGWINSPAGAYTANLTLKGKANFGFESKYQNGATVPTGTTDFQFNAAGFKFKSIVYDWLTVAGARAQYKGSGTVNGSGNYGFILTAIDGQINGGGNIDKFRIKIWDKGTGNALYDNQAGASDNGPVLTSIGGGSIVIHTGSKNGREASSVEPTLMADGLELRNYPNPIDDKTTIEFMLPQGGDYALLILDTRGSVVRQLQTGKAQAGQTNQISWEVGQTPGGLYITQLITGQGVKAIKLLVK